MAETSKHLIIVGGGPAGAMLSFLMARMGVKTTLIERHKDLSREFRGEGLSPSGVEVFRQAGLLDALSKLPASEVKSARFFIGDQDVLSLPMAEILPAEAMQRLMPQGPVLEMLIEKAKQFECFTYLDGVRVLHLAYDNGRVHGVVLDHQGQKKELNADYVISAEGRNSILRRKLGLDWVGENQSYDIVWTKLKKPSFVAEGEVFCFLQAERFGIGLPSGEGKIQLGVVIPKGSYKSFRNDDEPWQEKLAAGLPHQFAEHILANQDKLDKPILLDVISGSLSNWSKPGICFMGDAAHPMSPVGAQGINLALRDAIVAANLFGPALQDAAANSDALDHAAKQFEAERREEIEPAQKQQNAAPSQFAMASKFGWRIKLIPNGFLKMLMKVFVRGKAVDKLIYGAVPVKLTFKP